jgi:hypothetical protein
MPELLEDQGERPATVADVHALAESMPHVTRIDGRQENPVYQVGGKQSLVDDANSPFFTTPHFNGHTSVLVRAKDLPAIGYAELKEVIQDAWLSRASAARARAWLESQRHSR